MPVAPGHHGADEALVARARRPPTAGVPTAAPAARSRARSRCRARSPRGSRSVSLPVSAPTSAVLPWSMWPAVPRVSGGPGALMPRAARAARRGRVAHLVVGERAGIEQEPAPSRRARRRAARPREAARQRVGAERAGSIAHTGPSSSSSGSAPPPTLRRRADDAAAPPHDGRGMRSARAWQHLLAGGEHRAAPGRLPAGAPGRGRGAASPPARPATACRCARRAPADARGSGDGLPACPPSGRPAARRAACRPRSTPARRPPRPSGARVARRASAGRPRRAPRSRRRRSPAAPSRQSASTSTSSTKPTVRKFDWCARRIAPVSSADRALVVGQARAVGRAHLDQARARLRRAPRGSGRSRRSPPAARARPSPRGRAGQRRRGQQHGGGAVVDGERRLGAGELAQEVLHVGLARAAPPGLEVVLEVGVAGGRRRGRLAPPLAAAAPGRGSCARSRRWR